MASDYKRVDMKGTGKRIKERMTDLDIDAYKLSQLMGVRSTTNVYAWTQGRILPNTASMVVLSQILECRIDDLIALEEG